MVGGGIFFILIIILEGKYLIIFRNKTANYSASRCNSIAEIFRKGIGFTAFDTSNGCTACIG